MPGHRKNTEVISSGAPWITWDWCFHGEGCVDR